MVVHNRKNKEMGETKVQGCEEKEKVLLLWERALTLFYENDDGGRIVVRFKYEQSIQDAVKALHTG